MRIAMMEKRLRRSTNASAFLERFRGIRAAAPQNTTSANDTPPEGVMWKSLTRRARIAVDAP